MEQKLQSNIFVDDLYSQIANLSLEIAESKKVCGIFIEFRRFLIFFFQFCDANISLIDGLQQLEQHNDELLKQSATNEKEIVQLKHEVAFVLRLFFVVYPNLYIIIARRTRNCRLSCDLVSNASTSTNRKETKPSN